VIARLAAVIQGASLWTAVALRRRCDYRLPAPASRGNRCGASGRRPRYEALNQGECRDQLAAAAYDQQISDFSATASSSSRHFGAAEMKDLARWTDEVENYPETPGKFMMYFEKSLKNGQDRLLNRLENFYPYHDGFRALFDGAKLRGAVAELLGEPAILFKDKINFKMPGGDGFKPHQDQQAGWGTYTDFFITALVSIDEACERLPGALAGYHDRA
jgi:hypothetical protein